MFGLKRHGFLLYCAAVAALMLVPYLLPALPPLPVAAAGHPAVDGELSEVVSSVYAPDGRRRYRSESALVRHLHEDDVLTLEPLAMEYYSDGVRTMLLKSESGRVLDRGERVELNGAVELDRPAGAGRAREVVNTRNVEVRTEQWIAVTQEQVAIERGSQVMSGRGMVADLKRGEIRLLSGVKAQHEP